MKVKNYLDYRLFDYWNYIGQVNGKDVEIPKPDKSLYVLGNIVYIKEENALGVVIGCIDNVGRELRTDMSGMVSFSQIKLATPNDFKRESLRIAPQLFKELYS